jgi:hypothetical protein
MTFPTTSDKPPDKPSDLAHDATVDLSVEQQVMVTVLEHGGHTRTVAEAIVRADRVTAYALGSHIVPILADVVAALVPMIEILARAAEGER